ncbi:MAG: sensor histidine kinase, partial [Gemmatimonadaceae bacterium]
YDADGKLFARYPAARAASEFPRAPERDGFRAESSRLVGYMPVVQGDNTRLGTLYLESDKSAMYERLSRYTILAGLVMLVSLAVAYLLSAALQGQISRPILSMAETAKAVSQRGDYSVRTAQAGGDELGLLTGAFNHMLDQIEAQDRAIRESHERLNLALKASGVGTWVWEMAEHRISWDEFTFPLFGLQPGAFTGSYGAFLELVHREDRDRVHSDMQSAADTDVAYESVFRVLWPDGTIRDLSARGKMLPGTSGQSPRMTGVFWDITERKRAEERMKALLVELERSNKELELFAYVASHDLQEPLRMVSSYTQLLERRYSDKLDDDAREFIGYAVDGASRMQRLINDLLDFSRVSTRGRPLALTDLGEILGTVRSNLSVAMEESGAVLTSEQMPQLIADAGQIGQLMQNLVGNAIKFRNGNGPHVHVSAQEHDREWEISVRDDGIGIEPEY